MALKCGIIGLPNVGKSTLFNAITQAGIESANYPFCTINPNLGKVIVPDKRLETLSKIYETKKKIPTTYEFVDIAGLVAGASKGEGLGNQFLSHIREVDAIAHVVRCFENKNITHINDAINPKTDIDIINIELILADIESMEKRLQKLTGKIKTKNKDALTEYALTEKILSALKNSIPARKLSFNEEEEKKIKNLNLLTLKPIIYIANINENDINAKDNLPIIKAIQEIANEEGARVIPVSAQIESEIAQLPSKEKKSFLDTLDLTCSGLEKIIKATYELLGLITYFTAGVQECRAWTVNKGTKAPIAAGVIHTDFKLGFIKAEVINYEDLIKCGSEVKAKETGRLRIEGKEYIVKDGDIIHFRFNV